jgi:hypothetical protein
MASLNAILDVLLPTLYTVGAWFLWRQLDALADTYKAYIRRRAQP